MTSRPALNPISVPSPTILPDLPPVSALFLIEFDVKAGYTITWKKAAPGLELDGVVEYKSLPSGLHTVSEDLIYFIHEGGYAGLSAFVNAKTDEEASRNARMIAVGVLVPLSYGRLGRSWRHAEGLRDMAGRLAVESKDLAVLEKYWEENKASDSARPDSVALKDSPLSSPSAALDREGVKGQTNRRPTSAEPVQALVSSGHRLSPFHPAWSLTALLDAFGPLLFPIHRAALLRKRILISTHAPVHQACDFVYDISVLSNIPLSVLDILEPSAPAQRLRPLFTIGVNDIAFLTQDAAAAAAAAKKKRRLYTDPAEGSTSSLGPDENAGSGWVACTTDSILAMKPDFWDVLITMPPPHAAGAKERVWPTIELPGKIPVKATQRDLRRFRNLRAGIARLATPGSPRSLRPGTSSGRSVATAGGSGGESPLLADAEAVVEPTTWAALAYSGFMWWASAGEQRRSDEAEEAAHDASLLADLASTQPPRRRGSSMSGGISLRSANAGAAMADSVISLPATRTAAGRTARRAAPESTISEAETMARDEHEEAIHDNEENDNIGSDDERGRVELAIIAYFRRLTTQILGVLGDIADSSEDDDDGDDNEEDEDNEMESAEDSLLQPQQQYGDGLIGSIRVDSDALARMGLDVWSDADVAFVREVAAAYFARRALVESKSVEVCGLRVC